MPFIVEDKQAQKELVRDFQALRAAEYGELRERAEALLAELAREGGGEEVADDAGGDDEEECGAHHALFLSRHPGHCCRNLFTKTA